MAKKAKTTKKTQPAKKATKKATKKVAKKTAKSRAGRKHQKSDHPAAKVSGEQVWEAYERTRSIRAAARALGVTRGTVARHLYHDENRIQHIINDHHEECVAGMETGVQRNITMVEAQDRLIDAAAREIAQAAEEDRLTRILDEQGMPMPVPDARALLQAAKAKQTAISAINTFMTIAMSARSRGVRSITGLEASRESEEMERNPYVLHVDLKNRRERNGVGRQGLPAFDAADRARFLRDNPGKTLDDYEDPDQ
jgi:hypothetical protein